LAKAACITRSAQNRNYHPLSLPKADGFPSPLLLIAAQDQVPPCPLHTQPADIPASPTAACSAPDTGSGRGGKGTGEPGKEDRRKIMEEGCAQRRRSLNSALGCCSPHAAMQPGCVSRLDSPHLPAPAWEQGGNGDAISSPAICRGINSRHWSSPPSLRQPSSHFALHLSHPSPSPFFCPFSLLVTFTPV